jgi:hypothetical protein
VKFSPFFKWLAAVGWCWALLLTAGCGDPSTRVPTPEEAAQTPTLSPPQPGGASGKATAPLPVKP